MKGGVYRMLTLQILGLFFYFPSGTSCIERLIIFSAPKIGGRSGQGGRGKYALRCVGEEDFPHQA